MISILIMLIALLSPTQPAVFSPSTEVFTKINRDIVHVKFMDTRGNYVGDKFILYVINKSGSWNKYGLIAQGRDEINRPLFDRHFLGLIPKGRVPLYTEGIAAVVFDPNLGEEEIVGRFKEGTSLEIKRQWVRRAVDYIKKYRENLKNLRKEEINKDD